ncbi:MAG: BrnT family toxin [Pseudomonadota bacterium]|nr:BrnT family toxin [Pseudomonadota bacterium]
MNITFDRAKNARNIEERGLPFERGAEFDWETALAEEDDRKDYGERRARVFGLLGRRLHVAVITMRGETMHVISFRKANDREVRRYGQAKT